jgi:hypothetical protein
MLESPTSFAWISAASATSSASQSIVLVVSVA